MSVTVVALTGGIAAGKTTVTDVFTDAGIAVVDADQVARDAVAPASEALAAIATRFGREVLHSDGSLNREALGQIVFNSPADREALNQIVHPAVWKLSRDAFAVHSKASPDVPLVYAVPLLAESNRVDEFDAVIVVDAPAELRMRRLIKYRGMSEKEASSRIKAQATDEQRRAIADVLIDSSRSVDDTQTAARKCADALWAAWPDSLDTLPARF